MKKKNFDAGLYREGLRQLRVLGITMLAIFVLASVLVPLSDAVSLSAYPEWSPSYTLFELFIAESADPFVISGGGASSDAGAVWISE